MRKRISYSNSKKQIQALILHIKRTLDDVVFNDVVLDQDYIFVGEQVNHTIEAAYQKWVNKKIEKELFRERS